LLKQVTAAADHIVTVSDHSRDALLRLLALDPAKITNTYQAAPLNLAQDEPLPLGLQPGGYLLFCGSVEPRKNLGRLVAAHSRSGVNLPLVIIGPDGWRAKGELPKGMDEKIIRAPWLERAALDSLMRQAKALLFPSLAEGFGLPVLEAMVVGTPVMTSSQGALAEIANDAALTIDPYDIDAMADAIASLVYDTRLLARLSAAGLARSVAFSQAAYGARLTKVYSAVTAASPSTT
jgi:glycosyltransferase involved in cell wall biosynthesis